VFVAWIRDEFVTTVVLPIRHDGNREKQVNSGTEVKEVY
jgi:hypothetical protein